MEKLKLIRGRRIIFAVIIFYALWFLYYLYQPSDYVYLAKGEATKVFLVNSANNKVVNKDSKYYFTTVLAVQASNLKAVILNIKGEKTYRIANSLTEGKGDYEMDESIYLANVISKNIVENKITGVGDGAIILGVSDNSVAVKFGLKVGDVIKTINGTNILNTEELKNKVLNENLKIEVLRERELKTIFITKEKNEKIGIEIATYFNQEKRYNIKINDVGGSSGGLIFTLTMIDQDSQGDLTNNRVISGSGVVDAEGNVLPVEGIELKYKASEKLGADVFFAPEGERITNEGKLKVVYVSKVEDALKWLCIDNMIDICKN